MATKEPLERRMEKMRPGDVIEVLTRDVFKVRAEAYRIAGRNRMKISARAMFNGKGFEISLMGGGAK